MTDAPDTPAPGWPADYPGLATPSDLAITMMAIAHNQSGNNPALTYTVLLAAADLAGRMLDRDEDRRAADFLNTQTATDAIWAHHPACIKFRGVTN